MHESCRAYGLIDVERDVTSENEEKKINTNILDNYNSNNVWKNKNAIGFNCCYS